MVRWLANNVGLMILAVLLALAVWLVSAWQADPIEQAPLAARVVVTGLEKRPDTLLTNALPQTVNVVVRAPRSVHQKLTNDANGVVVKVDFDALNLPEGTHVVALTPQLAHGPAALVSSDPVTTLVDIAKLVSITLPISLKLQGQPGLGFRLQQPSIQPARITITATKQIIEQVAEISGSVSVDGARAMVEQTVPVIPRDSAGNAVIGVQAAPALVAVKIPLVQLSNYKDLAVRVRTEGTPAEGYNITNVASNPQIVTVFGANEVIEALPGSIETQPIRLEKATQQIEENIALNVPPNVSLLSNLTVSVTVKIEPIQGAKTFTRRIELIGVARGFTATVSPATVDIVLAGSLPKLSSLNDGDVRVFVDAKVLQAGVNQVEPQIVKPEELTVQSVQPIKIQVEIVSEDS